MVSGGEKTVGRSGFAAKSCHGVKGPASAEFCLMRTSFSGSDAAACKRPYRVRQSQQLWRSFRLGATTAERFGPIPWHPIALSACLRWHAVAIAWWASDVFYSRSAAAYPVISRYPLPITVPLSSARVLSPSQ